MLKCNYCKKPVNSEHILKNNLEVVNPRGFTVFVACCPDHKDWLLNVVKNGTGHYA